MRYLVTNDMLAGVWARLRDRLSAVDSSSSMVEVTVDYAAHFYDMYVDNLMISTKENISLESVSEFSSLPYRSF